MDTKVNATATLKARAKVQIVIKSGMTSKMKRSKWHTQVNVKVKVERGA